MLLAGCPAEAPSEGPWSDTLHPDVIAVVEDMRHIDAPGGRTVQLTFASGETTERDLNRLEQLGNSNSPKDGDLWIEGRSGGQPWYFAVPVYSDGCFRFVDQAREENGRVWFSSGLQLPMADDFEAAGLPSLNMASGVNFCLNERGEVTDASL